MKTYFRKTLMSLALMFACLSIYAQNLMVKGVVTDNEGPVPGVNVLVKGSTVGAITGIDGKYTISAPKNAVLVFSYVGYKDQVIPVKGKSEINIVLSEDNLLIDEVVVVGYGYQKKSDLATSVASVNTDEMLSRPASNVAEMLRGRAAGVTVTSSSGRPGSVPTIKVRGTRSITASNTPLYIIDGSPASATEFSTIAADDIESIEVLKDAASQSIYGARASDGVILVTTKRGKEGKTEVRYSGYVGVQTLWKNFDFYSPEEFYGLRAEAMAHDAGILDATTLTPDEVLADNMMLEVWENGKYVDWEKLMFKPAVFHNHDLSFKKGTEKLKVAASANYFSQEGMVRTGSSFERLTFRVNTDITLTKWLKFGVNAHIAHTDADRENSNFNSYIIKTPLAKVFNEDGTYTRYINSEGADNPLYTAQEAQRTTESDSYRLNAFMDIKPFKGFNYRLNTSFYQRVSEDKSARTKNYPGAGSSASINEDRKSNWLIENIITYDAPIKNKNHRLNITGVQSVDHNLSKGIGMSANNLPVDKGPDFIDNGQVTKIERTYGENNLVSFMLRGQYTLKDRYMLNLAMRADASSRFGKNNKWGYFPSVAFAWRITEEEWMKNVKWLNNLKFRASYGIVGNQNGIGNYTTLGLVDAKEYEFGDEYYMSYIPGSQLSNPNLKWEKSATANFGLDFSLLDSRLSGTFEYYRTKTTDLIVSRGINSVLGYTSMLDNLGESRSQGVEISLNSDLIRTKDWNWNVGTNFSWFKNEIIKIDDQVDEFGNPKSQAGNKWFIGSPINVYYDYKADGIYQYEDFDITTVNNKIVYKMKNTVDTDGDGIADAPLQYVGGEREPGDVRVVDANHDGKINDDDKVITSKDPDFTMSLSSTLSWKGLELYMDWYGVFGVTKLNSYLCESNHGGSLQGTNNGIKVNYWTPRNPSNEFPRPYRQRYADNLRLCAYQDASYIRLNTLSLAYNFPKKLAKKLSLSNLKVYATATNLCTFTDYLSYSPELSAGSYPEGRTYVFGLNLQF